MTMRTMPMIGSTLAQVFFLWWVSWSKVPGAVAVTVLMTPPPC